MKVQVLHIHEGVSIGDTTVIAVVRFFLEVCPILSSMSFNVVPSSPSVREFEAREQPRAFDQTPLGS